MEFTEYGLSTRRILNDGKAVVGFDPSLANTGVGVIIGRPNGTEVLTTNIKTDSATPLPDRLLHIGESIGKILKALYQERKIPIGIVGVETVFSSRGAYAYETVRLAQARGVVVYESRMAGFKVAEITPAAVKKIFSGTGQASKGQMKKNVELQIGIKPRNEHVADALGIAVCASLVS